MMSQGLALYSAQQSRNLDACAIHDFAIPGYDLMQRAAKAAWQAIESHFSSHAAIGFLVGPGNNGGDALEIARLAHAAGSQVQVHLLGDPGRYAGEAALAWKAFEADGLTVAAGDPDWAACDLWVDGLFGSGLQRDLDGQALRWVSALNAAGLPVIALDVPSGIEADSGAVMGAAVKADLCVSFIARKAGLFTGDALDYVGLRLFDDLGLPKPVFDTEIPTARTLSQNPAWSVLPARVNNSHKGHNGHVVLIGGAPGFSGAIRLAATAALRSGAGLVSVYTHDDSYELVAGCCPELMVHSAARGEALSTLLQRADVVVIGPGLGAQDWSVHAMEAVLRFSGPCVIDADGLNYLAEHSRTLPEHWVITPHPGEAARLLQQTSAEIQSRRYETASRLTQRYGAISVLKGAGTIVADRKAGLFVCEQGNPGMAVAGMGDVLAGLCAALIAQLSADQCLLAVQLAVSAHAQAGDLVARRQGQRGLLPSDLIAALPEVLNP